MLRPHVSRWLLDLIADGKGLPTPGSTYSLEAAVLCADMVGSTALAERLAPEGAAGIEALRQVLDRVFTVLVEATHSYGGDVVHFIGDATICAWPIDPGSGPEGHRRTLLQACAAADLARKQIVALTPIQTPVGPVRPSVRFGIGHGSTRLFVLGDEDHLLWMLDGPALQAALRCLSSALPDQVQLTSHAAAVLEGAITADQTGGLLSIDAPVGPHPSVGRPVPDDDLLRHFVHPLLLQRHLEGQFAAEYRLVTTVFARWMSQGQSGLSLSQWMRSVQNTVAHLGGWLDNPVMDPFGYTLLIAFGAPLSYGEDVRRAITCALSLQQNRATTPPEFQLRIGISRGRLFAGEVGTADRHAYTLIGDEINVASRLAERASPGEVLVSAAVREQAGSHFLFDDLGPVALRGRTDLVFVYRVTHSRHLRPRLIRRYLARERPLFGRDQELDQLSALADRALRGEGQVVTIRGDAGIGKSAVAAALVQMWASRGGETVGAECVPLAPDSPYHPWRWIMLSLCQAAGGRPQQQVEALARCLAQLPSPPEEPEYWLQRLPLLAQVVGLKLEDNDLTRGMRGELRRDATFETIKALLWAKADERPLLLLIEDAHWADDLSVGLITSVAREADRHALLLALVYRPPLDRRARHWEEISRLPHHTALDLSELAREAIAQLVEDQLGQGTASQPLIDLVFERTRGHPLFTEELVRMFQDTGRIRLEDGLAYLDIDGGRPTLLPDTVLGAIQARIDRLDQDCRMTAKAASVIGPTFSANTLLAIHPSVAERSLLREHLAHLEQSGLIHLQEEAPDPVYAFHHAMTREAVYEGLPLPQRRELHRAVAQWYEEQFAAELSPYYGLLAHHYGAAGDVERELHFLLLAAEQAYSSYALGEVVNLCERALRLLDPDREPGRVADVLVRLAQAVHYLGQYERAESYLHRALGLYRTAGDPRGMARACFEISDRMAVRDLEAALQYAQQGLQAAEPLPDAELLLVAGYTRVAQLERNRGNFARAEEALERALQLAARAGDMEGLWRCYRALSLHHYSRGERWKALQTGTLALRHLEKANGPVEQRVIGLNNKACFAQEVGEIEVAIEAGEAGLALARRAGIVSERVVLASTLAGIYIHVGDWEAARRVLDEGWQLLEQAPHPYHQVVLWREEGKLAYAQGRWEEAAREWSLAEEASRTGAQQMFNAELCACLAMAYAQMGELSAASDWLAKAIRLAQERQQRGVLAQALRAQGLIESARGQFHEGAKAFRQALGLCQELNDPVQTVQTLLEYGQLLLQAGKRRQGLEILRQAIGEAQSIRLLPVVKAAQSLLRKHDTQASC